MARRTSPVRLILALSVAGVLAVFLVYVAIAGGTPQIQPSELSKHENAVVLVGKVVPGTIATTNGGNGLRFRLRDREGTATVAVTYPGTRPDQFKGGREISLHGKLQRGVFVGEEGTLVTKCPSKYSSSRQAEKS